MNTFDVMSHFVPIMWSFFRVSQALTLLGSLSPISGTSVRDAVGRLSGGKLVTTLVDCFFRHYFLLFFLFVVSVVLIASSLKLLNALYKDKKNS